MKKTLVKIFLCALALALPDLAFALPAQVLLLRHAEKPADGNELSDRGWERARALPGFFRKRPELARFGPPAALYGMAPKKKKGSVRAIQTLKYVAEDLRLPVIDEFTDDDVEDLVRQVAGKREYQGKLVVICWNHDSLRDIAKELGVKRAPKYPKDAFDRAWLISFRDDGAPVFEDLPERLLPGDSER